MGPNARHLATANNKVDLTSDPTEALALPMEATLAKDAVKLTAVDLNKATGPTLRTIRVIRVNRMEAREVLPEGILNKTDRIALHLNRGIRDFRFVRIWPFPLLLGSSLLALAEFEFSMRPDDSNTTFYSVHIFTAVRLTGPRSRDFSIRCGLLGDLRDDVQNGVHFNGILAWRFRRIIPMVLHLALLRIELLVPMLCAMLTFVGGLTRSKLATTTTTLQYSYFSHTLVTHRATSP